MSIGYHQNPAGSFERLTRWLAKIGSKYVPNTSNLMNSADLEGFRKAQRLAYDCVETVGKELEYGISEKEAAELLASYLKANGSERFIQRPFAWFGDHTRFDGYSNYMDYHPSDRTLSRGSIAILDVSPIVGGYTADVGYTLCLEYSLEKEKALAFLREIRDELPSLFVSELTPAEIWHRIDKKIEDAGYDNIHSRYPFCVLGHRVFKLKNEGRRSVNRGVGAMSWFSTEVNLKFLWTGFSSVLSPDNIGSKNGLWAIEPHIGWQGAGAKFEEILVVEDNKAYWLDDNVPHARKSSSED